MFGGIVIDGKKAINTMNAITWIKFADFVRELIQWTV